MANRMTESGTRSLADSALSAARPRSGVPRPKYRLSGPPLGSRSTCNGGAPSAAPSAREITMRWISLVPSKIV